MAAIIFFFPWKIFDLLISFFAPNLIHIQGFFPYRDLINSYNLPVFLTSFANFDGAHYISITRQGYAQYEQAFFPLYPLLIKFLSPIFNNNHLLTGLIISNTAFFIGLILLKKYLDLIFFSDKSEYRHNRQNQHTDKPDRSEKKWLIRFIRYPILLISTDSAGLFRKTSWAIILLLAFPTSFFLGSLYTEGLFFMLAILTFYFIKKERYYLAGICGFFASLTRLIGVFLIIPIIVKIIYKSKCQNPNDKSNPKSKQIGNWKLGFGILKLIVILFPILGLTVYSLYLFRTTGDPLYFFHAQNNFNLNRSTNMVLLPQVGYRYIKIFLTANHNIQYYVALFEFITFGFVLIILTLDLRKILFHVIARKRSDRSNPNNVKPSVTGLLHFVRNDIDRLGLNLFSFANLLLPTLTGTLLSIPRFSLISFSVFIYLAEIKNKWIKISIAIIFALLHIVVLSFFVRGYFIS